MRTRIAEKPIAASPPVHVLDYSPLPKASKRKWVLLCAAAILLIPATMWLRPAARQVQMLLIQRQSSRCAMPPSRIVFLAKDRAGELMKQDSTYRPTGYSQWVRGWSSSSDPGDEDEVAYRVPAWDQLLTYIRPSVEPWRIGSRDMATCFVHERASRHGTRRIVAVEAGNFISYGSVWWKPGQLAVTCVETHIFRPPERTWSRWIMASRESLDGLRDDTPNSRLVFDRNHSNDFRIYAGQPDPKDDSHFTIEIQVDGKNRVLEGWLQDDGTVKLALRIGDQSYGLVFN